MKPEAMAFVLGGLLIASAIFGGGIEVKEFKVPQVSGSARFASALAGTTFITLAVSPSQMWLQRVGDASTETASASAVSRLFVAPVYRDLRLDACAAWKDQCGEPAASQWCRSQGYLRGIDYPIEYVGENGVATRLIGEGTICRQKMCASFAHVACTR
jgi:hypothetical protein